MKTEKDPFVPEAASARHADRGSLETCLRTGDVREKTRATYISLSARSAGLWNRVHIAPAATFLLHFNRNGHRTREQFVACPSLPFIGALRIEPEPIVCLVLEVIHWKVDGKLNVNPPLGLSCDCVNRRTRVLE